MTPLTRAGRTTTSRSAGTCGCRSATGWSCRPTCGSRSPGADAPDARFPVILEMIPYGKDSWRRNGDTARGEWLAARGFALCRLDVRGTGSSPGVALDEYTEAETLDGYDAVEWLAAQPWCNANVGMWGISYGGFTAIQVAKLRPPHLRAILPMYATDDRYRDDVHIRGGCVTASEKSQYAVSQLGMNAMPPYPPFRGEGWREEWRARLEATPPWLMAWIREQTDGPYWRRGSLAPEYEALECAVFQVAGWSDAYVDPAFRIQERCTNARGPDARRQLGPLVPGRRVPGAEPRLDARARPVLRPLPQGHRQRLGGRARADLVRARVRRAGAVPRRVARALAGGDRVPGAGHGGADAPARRRRRRHAGGVGRRRRCRRGRRRSPTARRPAPAARSRGAPAGTPTASPATCARTRPAARRGRASRSSSRCRSSACRSRSSTSPRRCRSRPASSGCPRWRRTGPRRSSRPAC